MAERNPRIDPRSGDVVTRGGIRHPFERHVVDVQGSTIRFRQKTAAGAFEECDLDAWRRWCMQARVQHHAGDGS